MKRFTFLQTTLATIGMLLLTLAVPLTVSAAGGDVLNESCTQSNGSALCKPTGSLFGAGSLWEKIINTMIFIIGAVAVIMVVIGGFRYVTSGGDSSSVNSAKNTILYAVIGIVVAASAYAIVNFVLGRL